MTRVCLFSPDTEAFASARLRGVHSDGGFDLVHLTNSWAEPPPTAERVYVTAGAATYAMRGLRRILRDGRPAHWRRPIVRVLGRLTAPELIEGFRAADPDLIVSLNPAWTGLLGDLVCRHQPQWRCIGAGDPWEATPSAWRRYDPAATVSIVLPTHNGSRYLSRSLESCLTQTHTNVEVVVVDDGSTDRVDEIVGRFGDPRVKYVRHQTNLGLPRALNTGFAQTSGALLTWTSDDNYYAPDAIETMVRFLCTYPDVDFVYADSYQIDDTDQIVGWWRTKSPDWLKVKNRIGACFLYTRAVYETIGEYNPDAVLAEDYDYWLRVSRRFTMQRLFRTLYYYRVHAGSLTARYGSSRVTEQAKAVRRSNSGWLLKYRRGAPVA